MNLAPQAPSPGDDAALAATLFAIDPAGLGGVVLRASHGEERDAWIAALRAQLPKPAPVRRIPVGIEDGRLLGGLDLSASLAAGRPIAERGVLADSDGGIVILPSAERIEPALAARLAAVLDQGVVAVERDGLTLRHPARIGLVLLDEGVEDEERAPAALVERLAFHLHDSALDVDIAGDPGLAVAVERARARLDAVAAPSAEILEALAAASALLAIPSLRATLLALRAARAHAALSGRSEIGPKDAAAAARLVLAPRARAAPAESEAESTAPPEPQPPDESAPSTSEPSDADLLVQAILAALPEGLMDQVERARRERRAAARSGAGAAMRSSRRGRPAGSRGGTPPSGARLDLIATLRAAAPWQALRRRDAAAARIQVRREDFRFRRFVQRREATTIFVVDASGSTALQRLAEAKGAVELLLAKAYVTRAKVALIGFRGTRADLLLAPTRSLTRAKRSLADLPGGGGTPLAAGIDAALELARGEVVRGQTPNLVFLTDGRANIGRDGAPGRAAAEQDALEASRKVSEAGLSAVYLDTSPRPQPGGDRFAVAMSAAYAPLPYVEATAVVGLLDGLRSSLA